MFLYRRRQKKKAEQKQKPATGRADGRPQLHGRAGAGELLLRPPRRRRSQAIVVDPGEEADRLLEAIDELGLDVQAILLTHTHFDHVGAVAPVARATGAPVYCPQLEVPVLADIMSFVPWPGFGPYESYDADETVVGRRAAAARRLRHRRPVHARPQPRPRDLLDPRRAGAVLRRRAVPGLGRPHRPARRRLADALPLDRDPGRQLPAETTVYPGHMGITTLGRERATNPFLLEIASQR